MKMLMTGVYDLETADVIIEALKKNPMTTAELNVLLDIRCDWSLKKLNEYGAIQYSGRKECRWIVTGRSFRGTCSKCSRNELIWRINDACLCHKCRNGGFEPRALKETMYKEFDRAKPFNRLLQLPFGLDSKHYVECLSVG
ncbi:hypothetical protein VSVS12_03251 [Vibrio scophthalmi]|uniref:hypothetical protein n=1 Tax=Vibrio scophthalmi TaxID=45658 RepID=UPI0008091AEB|nr:hypothetical protein [Vibrio scophthalmi]ANS86960.1 hypothetical protein VSVS12_03251 [Vibrio scophthalmi]